MNNIQLHGQRIQATITNVGDLRTKTTINSTWIDPRTERMYTFQGLLHKGPVYHVGDSIMILVDPHDLHRYMMIQD
jgi:hypothetical protein